MAYQTQWLIENQVLYVQYGNRVDALDLEQSLIDALQYSHSSTSPVHVIMDCTHNPTLALSVDDILTNPALCDYFQHPETGWLVWLTGADHHRLAFMIDVLHSQLHAHTHLCASVDEAMRFLRQQDAALGDAIPAA